jgi:hypothetical protein
MQQFAKLLMLASVGAEEHYGATTCFIQLHQQHIGLLDTS